MTTVPPEPSSLLAELEARQDELLVELDALNERLEMLLKQWSVVRDERAPQPSADAA